MGNESTKLKVEQLKCNPTIPTLTYNQHSNTSTTHTPLSYSDATPPPAGYDDPLDPPKTSNTVTSTNFDPSSNVLPVAQTLKLQPYASASNSYSNININWNTGSGGSDTDDNDNDNDNDMELPKLIQSQSQSLYHSLDLPPMHSRAHSLSYTKRLGITDDVPLPSKMFDNDDVINKNQGRNVNRKRKRKKKVKKRIFTLSKSNINVERINKNKMKSPKHLTLKITNSLRSRSRSQSKSKTRGSKSLSKSQVPASPISVSHSNGVNSSSRSRSTTFPNTIANNHNDKNALNTDSSDNTTQRRKSVVITKVNNGITGRYISSKIANCAALFWISNMDVLQRKDQLEIGCVQYFYLLEKYPELNKFFKKEKIEETALRFFDMFGWLIRSLKLDGVDLFRVLSKIGKQHTLMGICVDDYSKLLFAFHYAMSESFQHKYTIEIKYCIDQIFIIATCIMTGHNYNQLSFAIGTRLLQLNDCEFLTNINKCLDSDIGKEYLFRYLGQTYCSEIVIFIKLYQEYLKINNNNHYKKLLKAKSISQICLTPNSEFPINVSYDANKEFWIQLKHCEQEYNSNPDDFVMDPLLFDTIWEETTKLILTNHWTSFVITVKKMQKQQSSVL